MKRRIFTIAVIGVFALLAAGTGSNDDDSREGRRARPASKAPATAPPAAPAIPPTAPPVSPPPGPPPSQYWDALVRFEEGASYRRQPCPENLHAIIDGYAPIGNEFERREQAKQRKSLASEMQEKTFVFETHGDLGEYDFRRHRFPVVVEGLAVCEGPETSYTKNRVLVVNGEAITIAFTRAKATKARAIKTIVREWEAPDQRFYLEMPEDEAEKFAKRGGVAVDIAFKVQRGRIDRWLQKSGLFGSTQDHGAGPLITTKIVAKRFYSGSKVLLDDAPSKATE